MSTHDAALAHYGAMLAEVGRPHLHTFSEPLTPDEPHKRRCRDCGEPQRYKAPTGGGYQFTDVLVDADDLRAVIRAAHAPHTSGYLGLHEAVDRVEALLPKA